MEGEDHDCNRYLLLFLFKDRALGRLSDECTARSAIAHERFVVEGFVHLGYPESLALAIGIVELACTVLYVIPQTAVLGAIVLTGYLGGATASHVRIGEPFHLAVLLGVLMWGGLYLRDERVRALIPLRN